MRHPRDSQDLANALITAPPTVVANYLPIIEKEVVTEGIE